MQRIVALFVASHYKNSPNDLQLLADSPSHRLFVLLGPMRETKAGRLPDILCVAQLALEGKISRASVQVRARSCCVAIWCPVSSSLFIFFCLLTCYYLFASVHSH